MGCECACSSKALTEGQKKILAAMEKCAGPCTSKEIAASTGVDAKLVSKEISELKKLGYVDSPARCKCGITDSGRTALSK